MVLHHFSMETTDEDFYYIDSDRDGLVKILEYYSNEIVMGFNSTNSGAYSKIIDVQVAKLGSDPNDPNEGPIRSP